MGKAEYRVVSNVAIGSILFKGMLVEFLIDASDLPLVQQYKWHLASNSYIATTQRIDCSGTEASAASHKKKEVYLHTLLLSPGPDKTVQHISKNGLDNRRCNLRLVDASGPAAAALSQSSITKKRSIELPPLCGIKAEAIPRHVWYVQANGYHGDRFAIELKTEKILWKTTSSKKVSLQEKLEAAKAKLEDLYKQYPYLDPAYEEEQIRSLQTSFEAILQAGATDR